MIRPVLRPLALALAAAAPLLAPLPALAVGTGDAEPPTQTETTAKCEKGMVWDEKTKECVAPKEGRLEDDVLFGAVREFAYFGQPEAALATLDAMREGETDRVLTYRGFASRKAGRVEEGMAWYAAALARNPDNILARSYMGQALVEQGEMQMAQAQLDQIRARGGAGTWAEAALDRALATGLTAAY